MDETSKSKTSQPSGGSNYNMVSNEELLAKLMDMHKDTQQAMSLSQQNQSSIRELTHQLNNGGIKDTLARIDERTKNMKELNEKQDERLTHLERRDWYVTAFSAITSSIAAFFGVRT